MTFLHTSKRDFAAVRDTRIISNISLCFLPVVCFDVTRQLYRMMELASLLYNYEREKGLHQDTIMAKLTEDSMAPLYEQLCSKYSWQLDEELLRNMKYVSDYLRCTYEYCADVCCCMLLLFRVHREKNQTELAAIEEKFTSATVNAGDVEVLDCMFAKAKLLSKVGSWPEALAAYDDILKKEKTGTGKKIDATMEKAKIALFTMVSLCSDESVLLFEPC